MSQCAFQWSDGWAPDHYCRKLFGHQGNHSCQCDAEISDWMINNAPEAIYDADADDLEADRQALREQLKALQDE